MILRIYELKPYFWEFWDYASMGKKTYLDANMII